MLTSMKYPFTQQFLYNKALNALDPSIIAEQKPIYLGISEMVRPTESDPTESVPAQSATNAPAESIPAAAALAAAEAVPAETTPADGEDERARDAAIEYLQEFVRCCVIYRKGEKLTSAQIMTAIESIAWDDIRTNLIKRSDITREVKSLFGILMEKESRRIDGRHQKYWADFRITLDRPPRRESP